jgi:hypothetical protein
MVLIKMTLRKFQSQFAVTALATGLFLAHFCGDLVPFAQADAILPGFGTAGATDNISIDPLSSVTVPVALEANRSYDCSVDSVFSTSTPSIQVKNSDGSDTDVTANHIQFRGNVAPIIGTGTGDNLMRSSVTPVTTGVYKLLLTNDLFATNSIKLRCMETTLYGGFNTNANPFNFLELSNVTGVTITGTVRAYNYSGTLVLTTDFSIPANRRFDVNLHDSTGPSVYGTVVVTHDGPLGAVQGNVSQYSGPASALSLRATVPLTVRDQRF